MPYEDDEIGEARTGEERRGKRPSTSRPEGAG
jgi:hypothetical protein